MICRVAMPVSDKKAWSRAVPVFFAREPVPPSVRHIRPPTLSAEEMDILCPGHSVVPWALSRYVVPDFFLVEKAFCRRRIFLFTALWNDLFCYFMYTIKRLQMKPEVASFVLGEVP